MRTRDERGVVFPSPVVMLSVIAVAMAALAFFATRGPDPTEREITPTAHQQETVAPAPHQRSHPATAPTRKATPIKPAVQRGKVLVEVYNNSGITGLAARIGTRADQAGWQVVGEDNWYGSVPASTVYYPARLEAAAKLLALDLGIRRVQPAVDAMKLDRLTLILTADPTA